MSAQSHFFIRGRKTRAEVTQWTRKSNETKTRETKKEWVERFAFARDVDDQRCTLFYDRASKYNFIGEAVARHVHSQSTHTRAMCDIDVVLVIDNTRYFMHFSRSPSTSSLQIQLQSYVCFLLRHLHRSTFSFTICLAALVNMRTNKVRNRIAQTADPISLCDAY